MLRGSVLKLVLKRLGPVFLCVQGEAACLQRCPGGVGAFPHGERFGCAAEIRHDTERGKDRFLVGLSPLSVSPRVSRATGKMLKSPDHASGRAIRASRVIFTSLCTFSSCQENLPAERSQTRPVHPNKPQTPTLGTPKTSQTLAHPFPRYFVIPTPSRSLGRLEKPGRDRCEVRALH